MFQLLSIFFWLLQVPFFFFNMGKQITGEAVLQIHGIWTGPSKRKKEKTQRLAPFFLL